MTAAQSPLSQIIQLADTAIAGSRHDIGKPVLVQIRQIALAARRDERMLAAENERFHSALKEAYSYLQPHAAPCCDGCEYEWNHALAAIKSALAASKGPIESAPTNASNGDSGLTGSVSAADPIKLNIIRGWPNGMAERVEAVWNDLPGFIINYKLYDLSRVLAEFGFDMLVYERKPESAPTAESVCVWRSAEVGYASGCGKRPMFWNTEFHFCGFCGKPARFK